MTANRVMIAAGFITVVQAVIQVICVSLGLAQFFCVIDFLQDLPLLLYIRILYFHNSDACGSRVNIGHAVEGIADQAFVLLSRTPLPANRTFVVNCFSLAFGFLWIITSGVLIASGAKGSRRRLSRWPWILMTSLVSALDVVAAITFVNDSFYTRSLTSIMSYVGGVVNGAGNTELSTAWAAWVMAMLYSRFVIIFIINLLLLVFIIIEGNLKRRKISQEVEAPMPTPTSDPVSPPTTTNNCLTNMAPLSPSITSIQDEETSVPEIPSIPRAVYSHSFRRMKKSVAIAIEARSASVPDSLDVLHQRTHPKTVHVPVDVVSPPLRRRNGTSPNRPLKGHNLDLDSIKEEEEPEFHRETRRKTKHFPLEVVSGPLRRRYQTRSKRTVYHNNNLEIVKEEDEPNGQRETPRKTKHFPLEVVSGPLHRSYQTRSKRTVYHNNNMEIVKEEDEPNGQRERRGTAAELQGELPWASIPTSTHRMRDQLARDENLPPTPLADYTAIPISRKASVDRASSILTQKKEIMAGLAMAAAAAVALRKAPPAETGVQC